MAVAPLFVADMPTLKASLRLTGMSAGDASRVFDGAVSTVRVLIYTRLGIVRVTELLTTTFSDTPTTNAQILRMIGNLLEALWVRVLLMDKLPTIFMDASGASQQIYNDEAAFRSTGQDKLADERLRDMIQIEEWLGLLGGEVVLGPLLPNVFTQDPDPDVDVGHSPWAEVGSGPGPVPGTFDGNFRANPSGELPAGAIGG